MVQDNLYKLEEMENFLLNNILTLVQLNNHNNSSKKKIESEVSEFINIVKSLVLNLEKKRRLLVY